MSPFVFFIRRISAIDTECNGLRTTLLSFYSLTHQKLGAAIAALRRLKAVDAVILSHRSSPHFTPLQPLPPILRVANTSMVINQCRR